MIGNQKTIIRKRPDYDWETTQTRLENDWKTNRQKEMNADQKTSRTRLENDTKTTRKRRDNYLTIIGKRHNTALS